jgi:hypothetical protein
VILALYSGQNVVEANTWLTHFVSTTVSFDFQLRHSVCSPSLCCCPVASQLAKGINVGALNVRGAAQVLWGERCTVTAQARSCLVLTHVSAPCRNCRLPGRSL